MLKDLYEWIVESKKFKKETRHLPAISEKFGNTIRNAIFTTDSDSKFEDLLHQAKHLPDNVLLSAILRVSQQMTTMIIAPEATKMKLQKLVDLEILKPSEDITFMLAALTRMRYSDGWKELSPILLGLHARPEVLEKRIDKYERNYEFESPADFLTITKLKALIHTCKTTDAFKISRSKALDIYAQHIESAIETGVITSDEDLNVVIETSLAAATNATFKISGSAKL